MVSLIPLLSSLIENLIVQVSKLPIIQISMSLIIGTYCALFSVIIWRTLEIGYRHTKQLYFAENDYKDIVIEDSTVSRFQEALRFKTISTEQSVSEFTKMIKFIKNSFKTIHSSQYVTMETVADQNLLYTISGSDKRLTPYLLLTHIDVVPAEPSFWILPPFSGKLKDGYIYSRGAMDFKNGVMGILEALEHLLSNGFKPSRTFYISIGCDGKNRGCKGVTQVSKLFHKRGLKKLEFILDRGCTVTGEADSIVMIGVTEKSVLDLTLTVKSSSGHPAYQLGPSPYGILAKAITKLENHTYPSMLGQGPEKDMLENLAPIMNIWYKIMWSNIWLFNSIISKTMSLTAPMNAIIRTVHTVTDIHSDNVEAKTNKVPESATANIRLHVHPSQTVNDIITHFRNVIKDSQVIISTIYRSRMASVSPYGSHDFGYQTVCKSIYQVFQPYLIAPGILATTTASSNYHMFTNNIYRFSPIVTSPGDEQRYHGKNERMSVKNYGQTINFYKNIITNADKSSL
jgi:carboxypeptidase PM20D1